MKPWAERLRAYILDELKISANEAARRSGVAERTFNNYVTGERDPDYATLIRICQALNLSPNDLLGFQGNSIDPTIADAFDDFSERTIDGDGQPMFIIDELDVSAGMATGGQVHESESLHYSHEHVVTRWRVPASIIRAVTNAEADSIKIITVVGESNKPEFMPGERLMINTSDKRPSPAGFFAIWDGFSEIVKRLDMIPYSDPPRVLVMSANPAYPTRELLVRDVIINGRVIGKWLWT